MKRKEFVVGDKWMFLKRRQAVDIRKKDTLINACKRQTGTDN